MKNKKQIDFQKKIIKEEYVSEKDIEIQAEGLIKLSRNKKTISSGRENR
ncbi:hypothetical protein [Peribacillus sp. SI8-4]|nr:hypothetical protein [Peribacillus sp. SI8-4]